MFGSEKEVLLFVIWFKFRLEDSISFYLYIFVLKIVIGEYFICGEGC